MPRPDLTRQRTEEILDAFERCILTYGLDASSLEMVAAEAGMKRPIIRHYVGNREDLILALTRRFVTTYREHTDLLIASLGEEDRVGNLLELLFSDRMAESAESVLIYEHLILAANHHPKIRKLLADWTEEFLRVIRSELALAFPGHSRLGDVAYGVVSIYYNQVSLQPLDLPGEVQSQAKRAALLLVDSLRDSPLS